MCAHTSLLRKKRGRAYVWEHRVRGVSVVTGGRTFVFGHDGRGVWNPYWIGNYVREKFNSASGKIHQDPVLFSCYFPPFARLQLLCVARKPANYSGAHGQIRRRRSRNTHVNKPLHANHVCEKTKKSVVETPADWATGNDERCVYETTINANLSTYA